MFAEMMRQKPLFRGETDGDIVRSMIDILGSPSERHWPVSWCIFIHSFPLFGWHNLEQIENVKEL